MTPTPLPPGPKTAGFVLEVPRFRRGVLPYFAGLSRRYPVPLIHIQFGPGASYIANAPETIREMLVQIPERFSRSRWLGELRRLVGAGLLTSDEAAWVPQRRRLNPAYLGRHREAVGDATRDETARALARWRGTVDVQHEAKRVLLRALVRIMMSPDMPVDEQALIADLDTLLQFVSMRTKFVRDTLRLAGIRLRREAEACAPPSPASTPSSPPSSTAAARARCGPASCSRRSCPPRRAARSTRPTSTTRSGRSCWRASTRRPRSSPSPCGTSPTARTSPHPSARKPGKTHSRSRTRSSARRCASSPPSGPSTARRARTSPSAASTFPAASTSWRSPTRSSATPPSGPIPTRFRPERFAGAPDTDALLGLEYLPFSHGRHTCIGKRMAMQQARQMVGQIVTRGRPRTPRAAATAHRGHHPQGGRRPPAPRHAAPPVTDAAPALA